MTLTGNHFEQIVCDVHLTDMAFGDMKHSVGEHTQIETGHRCTVDGCARSFGRIGYGDVTEELEFINVRTHPICSNQHKSQAMYIHRVLETFQWRCPVCNSIRGYDRATDRIGYGL